jgi:hypothetical protein
MNDIKHDAKEAYREAETTARKAWRNRDGEDLGDKAANAGDEIRKDLGNAGDDIREGIRDAREGESQAGRR